MISNLLAAGNYFTYIILGVLIVAIVVMFVFSSKRRKKQEEDAKNLIDAVKPGNKVKTIGGICGIVVEVDAEENTFVLETGSEQSGKCFIKFDRQAIYQTDAVVDKNTAPAATVDEPSTETVEETPAEPFAEEVKEEAPVEDVKEEAPEAATPKTTKKSKKN